MQQSKGHLYNLKIIDSPKCICGNKEDSIHFFFNCVLYRGPRVSLHNTVSNLAPFTLDILLSGSDQLSFHENSQIINATIKFIDTTMRFKN